MQLCLCLQESLSHTYTHIWAHKNAVTGNSSSSGALGIFLSSLLCMPQSPVCVRMCLRLCRQPCEDRSVALRFSKVISSLLKQPVAIMCTCTPSNHNCLCLLTHLFYCKRRRARGGVVRAAAWAIFQMIFSLLSSDQWPASQSHIWLIMSWSGSCSHSSEQLWYESISPALGEVKWNPSILKSPPTTFPQRIKSGFGHQVLALCTVPWLICLRNHQMFSPYLQTRATHSLRQRSNLRPYTIPTPCFAVCMMFFSL